jgi:pimeloyl-ACP methyl ester carboxylesterase
MAVRFVLVHGGFHGAWCWSRTIPELEQLGYQSIAVDLPGHGTRKDERSTLADRRDAIVEVLQPGDVLVGHSGGGFDVTLAADAASDLVSHVVYLAAGLPLEGRTVLEATGGATSSDGGDITNLMTDETGMSKFVQLNASGRMECVDYEATRAFFYHDCDDETAAWAYNQLTPAPLEFLTEVVHLERFWAADPPRSYILCREDRAKPLSASLETIERLGVEPLEIEGSHSPFLSRPRDLAELLVNATTTKPLRPLSGG